MRKLNWLPWSRLAAFGNTPLAKAVVFTPLVAGYVYYSSEYLQQRWGFENALWLYWSLLGLSLGQLIYTLAAPRSIKKHGDNIEAYVDSALRTWSDAKFKIEAIEHLRYYFVPYYGSLLPLYPNTTRDDEALNRVLEQWGNEHEIINMRRNEIALIRAIQNNTPIRPTNARRINCEGLIEVLSAIKGGPLSEQQERYASQITRFMNINEQSDDWKKELLEKGFAVENVRYVAARYLVALLYGLSSLYFVWNTAVTVVKISDVTFR